ncbi:MAG TPA: hypothetical protein VFY14_21850 [Streptomyces sp.]|nr:hypothetical protein [Streptomyces sp.]
MSYPPPPHSQHNSGHGGGFGPPQGFGPSQLPGPPTGGYGYPPPAGPGYPGGPGGYGPGGPGGPFPPPPPGGGGGKVAAIVVAVVLVAGLVVGGAFFFLTTLDDGEDGARPSGTPSAVDESEEPSSSPQADDEPTDPPSPALPSPDVPEASALPSDLIPFVVLKPGTCFDHPSLSSGVTEVEKRSCHEPHNGEVIANQTLTGDFDTQEELQDKVMSLCKADAEKRLKRIPADGRSYYFYALYPTLTTYKYRGEDQISCSLTLSMERDGQKLTAPLPG